MAELEGRASLMAWDWDAEDIDPQEDDGKMWVPVTPGMLNVPANMKDIMALQPTKPLREIRVYAVKPSRGQSVQQTSMPQTVPMATPQMRGPIVLKATLGRGHSLREEETTVGEDREDERSDSDVTEPPATFKPNPSRGNMKTSITGRTRVPKRGEVIVSTEPR